MLASEVIAMLKAAIEKHGDLPLVSGVKRTGYGEAVIGLNLKENTVNLENQPTPVFDLVLCDDSSVATGSW